MNNPTLASSLLRPGVIPPWGSKAATQTAPVKPEGFKQLETDFKARYAYARVTFAGTYVAYMPITRHPYDEPVEVIVGVEMDLDDRGRGFYTEIRTKLGTLIHNWIGTGLNDALLAYEIEQLVRVQFPGRSYFLEVGRGALDEYVQIFEPKEFGR